MMGDLAQETVWEGLPPMAVPMTVKMPEPTTIPMPSAVSETGPSDFLRQCSGTSESEMSLSIDLVAKSWDFVSKIWRARARSSSVGDDLGWIDCSWLKGRTASGDGLRSPFVGLF